MRGEFSVIADLNFLPQNRGYDSTINDRQGNDGMDQGPTILVADADEETRLALIETIIEVEPSAKVISATNGLELSRALASGPIDIVLIDVVLPQTNGADLLAWRNSGSAGPRSMVVLVTDLLATGWPSVARRIGAYDVILKPLAKQNVERVIEASRVTRRRLSLMVVDPSAATRKLITRLLGQSQFSFEVVEAPGGKDAVRLAKRRSFDMAIVEQNLPDFPALEVACLVNDRYPEAKLVMMGVEIEERLLKQLETFGVSGFLKKPFSFTDVDKIVHRVFGLWHPYLITAIQAEEAKAAAAAALAG